MKNYINLWFILSGIAWLLSAHLTAEVIPDKEFESIFKERVTLAAKGKLPPNLGKEKHSYDCESLANYIKTGSRGCLRLPNNPLISEVTIKDARHIQYNGYEIWNPSPLWMRDEKLWAPVHFFVYLGDGKYLSKNGFGPVRIFDSYEDMLRQDAFPHGFVDRDGKITQNLESAVIGESIVFTRDDYSK